MFSISGETLKILRFTEKLKSFVNLGFFYISFWWGRVLKRKRMGYLPNFAILLLFSKSSFWYGFYLKNENEKFLFYLKYKENMCGSWFASQFTPPIPPPTNQPNAEIWHINVSVPKTKRWIIQIKNFHFCYQKNKTKHNSIFSKCKKVNQLMHFIFTKSTK